MFSPFNHKILNQNFSLSPNRTLFWENKKILILADTHFGKSTHFRKAGIAIPRQVFNADLEKLQHDINYFKPAEIIIVGDMFHSRANIENDAFITWYHANFTIPITLVLGNHDVLSKTWYSNSKINVVKNFLEIEEFVFQHDYEPSNINKYVFCGHVHPAIKVVGKGKQSLALPCFYFTKHACILPAFGQFTGLKIIDVQKGEKAFAIVDNSIITF